MQVKRGQSSVEALMILGIAMLFIIPLVIVFYSSTSLRMETLNLLQAKAMAQHLSDAAGEVWYEGPGARKTILVNYPPGMKKILLSGTPIPCPAGSICSGLKNSGREITLTFGTDAGKDVQIIFRSPAPIKNNYGITGEFRPSQNLNLPVSSDGTISPGITVIVIKNEGQYVNVVRYDPNINY